MYDIIVVGAGTAGLSAAIYGVRAGKTVLVFEGLLYGGQIANSPEVENYPGIKMISGVEFAKNLYEQAVELGAEVEMSNVTGILDKGEHKVVISDNKEYDCKTIILATGAKNKPLGLDRENELTGRGVSYCATCDGPFFKDKTVAIVGGGNTALEDAIFLTEYCEMVYLIHRRDSLRGEKKLVDVLKQKPNFKFILDTKVIELKGSLNLEAITIENIKTNDKQDLIVSGIFVAIGQMPENEIFSPLIKLDKAGYIVAGEECKTNIDGIFVAGDCRTKKIRQLATATSDGAVAALAACEYIL